MSRQALLLLLALACVFGGGFLFGLEHNDAKVSQAKSEARSSAENAKAASDALADVQRRLDRQKDDLERARQIAAIALDQRDTAQADLAKLTQQRTDALRTAARESPDCVDLAHMPICPAVAERLFAPSNDPASSSR